MRTGLLTSVAAAALIALSTPAFAAAAGNAQDERATAALNLLEANGYGSFSNFRDARGNFEATVLRAGRPTPVVINPDTGKITPQMNMASQGASSAAQSGSSTAPAAKTDSSTRANQVYHEMYNPEGGAPPTVGPEAKGAKKH